MEKSPLPVKSFIIYAYAQRLLHLSRVSLLCHTCSDTGPRSFSSHPRNHLFSCLLRQARCVDDLFYPFSPWGSYLDIVLGIYVNGKLTTQRYDKVDDLRFSIVNSPYIRGNIP